jgi:chromatin remodeling complex protein RSC6
MFSQFDHRISSLEAIISQLQIENETLKSNLENKLRIDRYMSDLKTTLIYERRRLFEKKTEIGVEAEKCIIRSKSLLKKGIIYQYDGNLILESNKSGNLYEGIFDGGKLKRGLKMSKKKNLVIVEKGSFVDHKITDGVRKLPFGIIQAGIFVDNNFQKGVQVQGGTTYKGIFVDDRLRNGASFEYYPCYDYTVCCKGVFDNEGELRNGIEARGDKIRLIREGKPYEGIDKMKYLDEYTTYDEDKAEDNDVNKDKDEEEEDKDEEEEDKDEEDEEDKDEEDKDEEDKDEEDKDEEDKDEEDKDEDEYETTPNKHHFDISQELAEFLGKEAGDMMSRVEVGKEINAYITANQLKDGRNINPDAKLTKLLRIGKDDVLTYFNLQKYLKIHFIKTPC